MRLLHVVAGLMGLLSGTVALYALKGAGLHRKSGMVFVYSMLILSSSGALLAALEPNVGSVMGGVLTFYLVLTAVRTVRRPVVEFQRVDAAATLMALALVLAGFGFGIEAAGSGTGAMGGIPAPVFFMFGTVALLATIGDLRVVWGRRLQEGPRLARHLWRMCFAFWIATASFFLGPSQRLPRPLRHSPLRPVPVVLVLLIMFYWLARVSLRQRRAQPIVPPTRA